MLRAPRAWISLTWPRSSRSISVRPRFYAHCRPLGTHFARLSLERALPLHIGDRLILRGTGQRLNTGGATVLDLDPPQLRRRGAAKRRAETLERLTAATTWNSKLLDAVR